jgi:hypothetical protein
MENFKVALWDDSWDAKSWYGGQEECSPSMPSWEYATSFRSSGSLGGEAVEGKGNTDALFVDASSIDF